MTTTTHRLACINCARTAGYLDLKAKKLQVVGEGIKKIANSWRCGHCGGRVVSEVY